MIKVSQLLVEVSKIGLENPDTVYYDRVKQFDPEYSTKYCRYQVAGHPGCIIGLALSNLGFTNDDLQRLDNSDDAGIVDILQTHNDLFEIDDRQAIDDLRNIQEAQDAGFKWGKATERIRI